MGGLSAEPVPHLVRDINTTQGTEKGMGIGLCAAVNGKVVFAGVDLIHGQQLWVSDGTAAGTRLLKTVSSGSAGHYFQPVGMHAGSLYFLASGRYSSSLWKTDGTPEGTIRLSDGGLTAQLGIESASAGGLLYFVNGSDLGFLSSTLWRTDGTPGGTMAVNPVHWEFGFSTAFYDPRYPQTLGSSVYFVSWSNELWTTDGTETGSHRLATMGADGSTVTSATIFKGALYYTVQNGTAQTLWKSDGTETGTVAVKAIPNGSQGVFGSLCVAGNTLYFCATDSTHGTEVWKTNGTAAGTALLKDIVPGTSSSAPSYLTAMNGALYFKATTSSQGAELWRSTGTAVGTTMLKNIRSGAGSSYPRNLTAADNVLYFNVDDDGGTKLWKTTGTAAGTIIVQDASAPALEMEYPAAVGNSVYFRGYQPATGTQLWRSDGTVAGTSIVKNLNAGSTGSSVPTFLSSDSSLRGTAFGGKFFLQADDGLHGDELWQSDGSSAGTELVKDIVPGPEGTQAGVIAVSRGMLQIRANNPAAGGNWKSDGTTAGTVLSTDPLPAFGFEYPPLDLELDGIFFDVLDDGVHGYELWRTDGTPAGTSLVKDAYPGPYGVPPREMVKFRDAIYFVQDDGAGDELWNTDGTSEGTRVVKDLRAVFPGGRPRNLTVAGDWLYFTADPTGAGRELWRTDGTGAGTAKVSALPAAVAYGDYFRIHVAGGQVFFLFDTADHSELWRSDGTAVGTVKLATLPVQRDSSNAVVQGREWYWTGSRLWFLADDEAHGQELWTSDGTQPGTMMVRDIREGSESAGIRSLTAVGSVIYFTAEDGVHGRELWKSDGSPAGTVMVADLTGEEGGSDPIQLTLVGGRLFMIATTDTVGAELYTLDVSADLELSFDQWASAAGLTGPDALPAASPNHDGVKNLLKFAFNLNPAIPDSRMLPFGAGAAGLPNFRLMQSGGTSTFRVEFLRRRNSGLTYVPQISASMAVESFVPMTGTTTVTPLDSDWERVAVEQAVDTTVTPRLFGRVSVSQP